MQSILSFPDRGPWGQASWRGNNSGHIQRVLIETFRPKLFLDICEGSGTSRDVCFEMGVDYIGFDLRQGVDFTAEYLLSRMPRPADMSFAHPPYGPCIDYGNVGTFSDPKLIDRDLSRCSIEEFLEKSRIMLLNQRECTRQGGHYCVLIGDIRRNGEFYSFQADYIKFLPRHELKSVVIKVQHNVASGLKKYNMQYPLIRHEYLLIWQRCSQTLYQMTVGQLCELKKKTSATWRALVRMALLKNGGEANLNDIYKEVAAAAGEKLSKNSHWQAKVRQTLQYHFESVKRGVWAIA